MKHNSTPAKAGLLISLTGLFSLAVYPVTVVAFEFATPGSGLCFGLGSGPYFADVIDGIPGSELIVTDIKEVIAVDDDMDGFRVVTSTATIRIFDRSGTEQWSSEKLKISSPDLATVISGQGVVPDFYIFPGLFSNTFATTLYAGGISCYNTAFAVEAGSEKYLAVILGFTTHTGDDEASGVDKSKVNVWILNRDTGAIVHLHKIRPVAKKFLSNVVFLSGIAGVDGDNDDELVVARANRGDGIYKLKFETFNILTGAAEEEFSVTAKNTRVFK